jgi:purine-nucleoside phosphorylase
MAWSDHGEEVIAAAHAAVTARGLGPAEVAIVLGSGLGGLADLVEEPLAIPFADIPGFPKGAVSGHRKALIGGRLEGRRVLVFAGRAHYYEGGDPAAMKVPLALAARLGVRTLLATNAAGSVNLAMPAGSIVAIRDHISLGAPNPLVGDSDERRFVPMAEAYDPGWRAAIQRAAEGLGLTVPEGVYMWWTGPSFETPAEVRLAGILGADLVGMSTVPEVIMARRLGLKVAALSVVTNLGTGMQAIEPNHHETKHMADDAAPALQALVRAILKEGADVAG